MKDKSDKSLKAAEALIDTQQVFGFNASIHCSYYALLQCMKYKLTTCSDPLPYTRQGRRGVSSHIFLLQEVKKRIKDDTKKQEFTKEFLTLKKIRVIADYKQNDFTEMESLDYKQQAEKTIEMLNQYLN